MIANKYRYVVIEGPIGAGKTSLAKRLADHYGVPTLLENASDNPFLASFYQDPQRYALSTQLFFLFQRTNQVRDMGQLDMFNQATVSDFILEKDMLFARLNLSDDEFKLYQQIYSHLQPQSVTPDLVIYLQAPLETLAERVKKRGIKYERTISDHYLADLAESYSRFFYQYEAAPLLIVNSENLNFAENQQDFELLLTRMEAMRGPREFFNRAD